MLKKVIVLLLILLFETRAFAAQLIDAQINRVERAQSLLMDVDARSKQQVIDELNNTSFPEGNLQIYEAVASTYQELVERKTISNIDEKKSLYDSIRMNVAFLQFGGSIGHTGDKKLNQWIRQALKRYLSKDLLENDKLFYSLE